MEATGQTRTLAKTLANTHRGSERELILIILDIGGGRSWTFLERDTRKPEELPQKMEKERLEEK
jgi:hypothetical protein